MVRKMPAGRKWDHWESLKAGRLKVEVSDDGSIGRAGMRSTGSEVLAFSGIINRIKALNLARFALLLVSRGGGNRLGLWGNRVGSRGHGSRISGSRWATQVRGS